MTVKDRFLLTLVDQAVLDTVSGHCSVNDNPKSI